MFHTYSVIIQIPHTQIPESSPTLCAINGKSHVIGQIIQIPDTVGQKPDKKCTNKPQMGPLSLVFKCVKFKAFDNGMHLDHSKMVLRSPQ